MSTAALVHKIKIRDKLNSAVYVTGDSSLSPTSRLSLRSAPLHINGTAVYYGGTEKIENSIA